MEGSDLDILLDFITRNIKLLFVFLNSSIVLYLLDSVLRQ